MSMIVSNQISNLVPTPGTSDQNITVSNAVKTLSGLASTTTHVLFTLDGADARVTFDGDDPVADGNGHLYTWPANGVWHKTTANNMKIIRDGTVDAHLQVQEMTLP